MLWSELKLEVLTQADVDNVCAYAKCFNVTLQLPLARAIYEFNESDLTSKENLALEFMRWITTDPHFESDPLWKGPRERATQALASRNNT